jgi:hypothetical protein
VANAYPLDNVKGAVIRELSGTKSWLMQIENKAPIRQMDAEVNIGDYNYNVRDNATANAVADKTGTAVIADKGVQHTVNTTTAYYYQPVKYFPHELATLVRNGQLQQAVEQDTMKQVDAVLKALAAILVDALSDGALTKTATLADGSTNFAASTADLQRANIGKYTSVLGLVSAYNDGALPDWVIAHPTAYGNLIGYSPLATTVMSQTGDASMPYRINGIPLWSQSNGTSTKWGYASKPCLLMGANRHLIFRMNQIFAGEQITFQDDTGLYVLPVGVTATYGVDFTATTGLALGIGEVINGAS